jgi:hypothetical protein
VKVSEKHSDFTFKERRINRSRGEQMRGHEIEVTNPKKLLRESHATINTPIINSHSALSRCRLHFQDKF